MKLLRLMLALAFLAVLTVPIGVGAITIVPDNTWYAFDVDRFSAVSSGVEWIDLNGDALMFEFTLSMPAVLTIVDGGFGGGQFEVFDNLNLLGMTSPATATSPDSLGVDFDAALVDVRWSRGVYVLAAGPHSISGLLSRSAVDDSGDPLDATVGAIRVSPVPEPATWAMLVTGLGLLLGIVSFHKHNARKEVV